MTALSRSRPWYSQVDVALANVTSTKLITQSWMWALKDALTNSARGTQGATGAPPAGSLWTVVGSSDSVSANLTGSDFWTGSFDATKIVRAAAGTAHSWIVLQSPANFGMWLCIDYIANDTTMSFTFATAAFTGGSTTARPTSTKEIKINETQGTADVSLGAVTLNIGHKLNLVRDADGQFYAVKSVPGAACNTDTFMYAVVLANRDAADSTGGGQVVGTQVGATTSVPGTTTATGNTLYASMRTYNDVAAIQGSILSYVGGSTPNTIDTVTTPATNIGGKMDPLPVFVMSANGGISVRGSLPDVGFIQRLPGTGTPSTGTPYTFFTLGGMALPFDTRPTI